MHSIFIFLLIVLTGFRIMAQNCPDTRVLALSRGELPSASTDPLILPDGTGGFWMIYRNRKQEDLYSRIRIQKLTALGQPVFQGESHEISDIPGDQSQVDAYADGLLGLTLVWRQENKIGESGDLWIQRIGVRGKREFGDTGTRICDAEGEQRAPKIQAGEKGVAYVVWEDERLGEKFTTIYGQKISLNGQPAWGSSGKLICTHTALKKQAIVCEDARGGIYVLWQDYRSGTGWQLWYQSLTPQGICRYETDGLMLLRPENASQTSALMVPDGFGGFFFVCEKMDVLNYETDLYFGRVIHTGQLNYQYSLCTAFGEQKNAVLAVKNGEAIVLWEDKRNGNWDIYGQYISITTGSQHWQHNGVPVADSPENETRPAVMATLEFNDILLCWAKGGSSPEDIFAQKLSNFGERLWEYEGVPVCTDLSVQQSPVLCRNGEGGCWLAWTDFRHGSGSRVYFQHLNRNGFALQKKNGSTFILDKENRNHSGIENLQVRRSSKAHIWVVWEDYRKGPNDPDLYFGILKNGDTPEALESGIPLCTAPFEQTRPALASDKEGGLWIAWIDRRNGKDEDIYIQHIASDGKLKFEEGGKLLAGAPRSQAQIQIKPDTKGGVWLAWTDARNYESSGFDIYIQHISAQGLFRFETHGKALSNGRQDSHTPVLATSSTGDAGLVWMDNRNGYFNVWFAVLESSSPYISEPSPVALSLSHQRQPALIRHTEGWMIAWSEERYGQSKDKIYWLILDEKGRKSEEKHSARIAYTSERQVRPSLLHGKDGEILVAWQELTERADEGVHLRARILKPDEEQSISEHGKLIARLTHEKENIHLSFHTQTDKFLLGWIEHKTRMTASWSHLNEELKFIPDKYTAVCPAGFPQRNLRIVPTGKNEALFFWVESRDDFEKILVRKINIID